ncbi:MAG TPA: type VI secretion system baseplate subunit TssK [Chloroflexia bacterium]|jgi:type VI secretion system protein ImpJ|nr:type VI secretion system baseplate subunit TssK [Chloroflexia bacterium]
MSQDLVHKVVWSEGLLVGPQHFQQLDRYHEYDIGARVRYLAPYGWGAVELKVDAGWLGTRKVVALEAFRGVLPLGTPAGIPGVDAAPASREVRPQDFPDTVDRLDIYLALPIARPNGRNFGPSNSHATQDDAQNGFRYAPGMVTVVDECTGDNEQTIVAAKKNFRILFGNELTEEFEAIKVAEVARQTDGSLTLNQDYVPPCLVISASASLLKLLRDLVHQLTARSGALSTAWYQRALERQDGRTANPETLWLLGTLDGALALLNHFEQVRQVHPEVVYRSLAQLAGQLHVLSARMRVVDLPAYDHENLAGCFGRLTHRIATLLQGAPTPPGRLTEIHLKEQESAVGDILLYTDSVLEERLLTPEYRLHLIVEATPTTHSHHDTRLSETVPRNVTVAAFEQIDSYIEYAYGLRLISTTLLGKEPPRPDIAYFQLENSGEIWEAIQSLRTVAIYIPRDFRQKFRHFKVYLVAVCEQSASDFAQSSELQPGHVAAIGLV